ncbi:MAG: potassium transporter TrkG [Pseudomonadota bacterium]
MFPVAFHAVTIDDYVTARPFFYGGVVLTGVCLLVGLAAQTWRIRKPVRAVLLTIVGTYLVLPAILALPLIETVHGLSFLDGYFEMLSSLTTTGATLLDQPVLVPQSVHLWRVLIAWLGGLMIWVSAIALLAPLRLGDFELMASRVRKGQTGSGYTGLQEPRTRLAQHAWELAPIYLGLTMILWILLLLSGEDPFVAFCHAMSTLATSGISPIGGLETATSGRIGEAAIAGFFVFAIVRRSFTKDMTSNLGTPFWREPELRAAGFIIFLLTTFLILRHWVAIDVVSSPRGGYAFLTAAWGSLFTSLSFLTTTGFVSLDWGTAQIWSGLTTPGLILLGLALIGGGVATTAGGVKLLRVYILYHQGQREMSLLVHPSSVASLGTKERAILPQNAMIAWVFFMTFGISICATMLALTALGVDFEAACVLAIAALSTTGPLIVHAPDEVISLSTLPDLAKIVLCIAMILGRLGTLTIVALLNPGFWRV